MAATGSSMKAPNIYRAQQLISSAQQIWPKKHMAKLVAPTILNILIWEIMTSEIHMLSICNPEHKPQLEYQHLHWTIPLLQYPHLRK
jgi:hypothetical protein